MPDRDFLDSIGRIDVNIVNEEEFVEKYEKASTPCIIQGVSDEWRAKTEWTVPKLIEKYGFCNFKVGGTDSGRSLRMPLEQYIEYMLYNRDDTPLYLFESSLDKRKHPKAYKLLRDYSRPKYFKTNLFSYLDRDRMPPHRWFLIGPKRSGSLLHQDPLGTSAWNTSLMGHKRWLLIPPSKGLTKAFFRK